MKTNEFIQFCAGLEQKLDTCLFRQRDEEDAKKGIRPAAAAAGVTAAGAALGGTVVHRRILDRQSGMAIGRVAGAARPTYGAAATDLGKDFLGTAQRRLTPVAERLGRLSVAGKGAIGGAVGGAAALLAKKLARR